MAIRHFLTLLDLEPAELEALVLRAIAMKSDPLATRGLLHGRLLGMIFEKSSTRTRVAFEAGMAQLGGHAIFLSPRDTQLGRGEPISDSARVISSMVDLVMVRTFSHSIIETFAAHSRVPVINGLTDEYHPCQLLADIQTFVEHRGPIRGKRVAWIGDGNNMCNSYINAARQFDFELVVACPEGYEPLAGLLAANRGRVSIVRDPLDAARGAHLLATDVWASMGQEEEQARRAQAFRGYCLERRLLDVAAPDAIYLHCLPAHRGEEISAELMDAPASAIWDAAENRLHSQKALIEFLLGAA
jgi:ornithine carbamoyltransferase